MNEFKDLLAINIKLDFILISKKKKEIQSEKQKDRGKNHKYKL